MKKNREFTQEQILNSKAVVKTFGNNGSRDFPSPAEYLEGLTEQKPEEFTQHLEGSHIEISKNEDETENIVFKRFNLHYTFNIDDELQYNLGLVVALDKAKPIAKIYSGVQVKACLNMCIFNADQKFRFDLDSDGNSYKTFFREEFIKCYEKAEKGKLIIAELKKVHLTHEKVLILNGAILEKVFSENLVMGSNPIIQGIKLQADKESKYFAKDGLSAWLYYNSLTEYLDKKIHVLDIPEKALEIFECLKEFLQIDFKEEQKVIEPKQVVKKNTKKVEKELLTIEV